MVPLQNDAILLFAFIKLINIVMTIKNSTFGELTVAAALCSSAIMCASTASAAGFQLTEQSVAGMGRAHAGAGIVGDDVSAIHFNPAGMTHNGRRTKGSRNCQLPKG